MEKMDSKTKDFISANISELKKLFPQCVKEGKIDFEELKEFLGAEIISDGKERYSFNWHGKKNAKKMALLQTSGTLRPCKEESVDWDKTQNLVIEGDNLEAMRAMFKSYAGQIKMIYIDPPYNTGHDFVYKDNFSDNIKNYVEKSGQALEANPETNGRFHSTWLDMMYPRLMLARDLLKEDGVIFVSIDDGEVHDLRMVMNEIFGEENFVVTAVRRRRDSQANLSSDISPIHEYVLCYAKSDQYTMNRISGEINEADYKNPDNDPRGPYVTMPCTNKGGAKYAIKTPTGKIIEDEWRFKKETYEKLFSDNKIVFPKEGEGKPRYKLFLTEKKDRGVLPNSWWENIASNQEGTIELKNLFGDKVIFDNPKPSGLIKFILSLCTSKDNEDYILDFFAGSGTTAHAVLAQNAKDGGNRKFVLVQLPETTDSESEAFKSGYKNIADICKERIRRVIKKMKAEKSQKKLSGKEELDLGFKVFKLDTTNIRSWDPDPQNLQRTLDSAESKVKDERSNEDVLYEILLKYGISLTTPIKEEKVAGKTVHNIGEGYLYVCLDKNIGKTVIDHIVKLVKENKNELGTRVLFADHCFENDKDSVNAEVRLKQAGVEDIKKM